MKKITKILCIVLTLVMMLSLICSCTDKKDEEKDPTPAEQLMEISDESERVMKFFEFSDAEMSKLKSYKTVMEMKLATSYMGYEMSGDCTGSALYAGIGTDSYFELEKMDYNYSFEDLDMEMTSKMSTGYYDGKMFSLYEEDGVVTQKLWSPIAQADYLAYVDEKNDSISDFDFEKDDAQTMSCTKNSDGSWSVRISQVSDDMIEWFCEELFEDMDEMFAPKVTDLSFEIEANKELQLTSFKIDTVFEADEDDAPTLSMKYDFSEFDGVSVDAPTLDGYTEVKDLRGLFEIEQALEDVKEADNGKFVLQTTEIAELAGSKSTNTTKLDGSWRIDETDSLLKYDMDVSGTGYASYDDVKLTYDGKTEKLLTTQSGAVTTQYSEALSQEEAREYIDSLLDYCSFQSYMVSDMSVITTNASGVKNVYTLTVSTPYGDYYDEYISFLEEYGTITSEKMSFKIIVKEGVILSYETTLTFEVTTSYGKMNVSASSVCTYDYTE